MKINPQAAGALPPNFRLVRPVPEGQGGQDFLSFLKRQLGGVEALQHEADAAVSGLAVGKLGIQEAMIAVQKAEVSFRLLMQVRNKALEAYREVMHMQF